MTNRIAKKVLVLALLGAHDLAQDQGQSRTVARVTDVPADSAATRRAIRSKRRKEM